MYKVVAMMDAALFLFMGYNPLLGGLIITLESVASPQQDNACAFTRSRDSVNFLPRLLRIMKVLVERNRTSNLLGDVDVLLFFRLVEKCGCLIVDVNREFCHAHS